MLMMLSSPTASSLTVDASKISAGFITMAPTETRPLFDEILVNAIRGALWDDLQKKLQVSPKDVALAYYTNIATDLYLTLHPRRKELVRKIGNNLGYKYFFLTGFNKYPIIDIFNDLLTQKLPYSSAYSVEYDISDSTVLKYKTTVLRVMKEDSDESELPKSYQTYREGTITTNWYPSNTTSTTFTWGNQVLGSITAGNVFTVGS